MNTLIREIADSILSYYDAGVVDYNYYPITDLWEFTTEDKLQALNILDDISAKLPNLFTDSESEMLDIHCIFQKRKTHIYLQYKNEDITTYNDR